MEQKSLKDYPNLSIGTKVKIVMSTHWPRPDSPAGKEFADLLGTEHYICQVFNNSDYRFKYRVEGCNPLFHIDEVEEVVGAPRKENVDTSWKPKSYPSQGPFLPDSYYKDRVPVVYKPIKVEWLKAIETGTITQAA